MSNQKKRIGIDCRFASTRSGIGRYVRELRRELAQRDDGFEYVFLEPDIPHYSLAEQLYMPKVIREAKIDLLHVPHFNIPLLSPVPIITTIHDLTLHHFPNQASLLKRLLYRVLMYLAVKRSKRIIAVSDFTANEIAMEYGEGVKKKMTVTHEGVSPQFRHVGEEAMQKIREKYNLYDLFILYVGACKQHKNVQALIDALAQIKRTGSMEHLLLVLVTAGKEVSRLHLTPDVRILSAVTDEELPALYSAAECFVMPSLYEGFGLPALEAMACGCRVVASNRTSLPEICNEHAIMVPPTIEGLRNGIVQALEGEDDPTAIRHAQSFSWGKMAEETLAAYRSSV